MMKCLKNIIIDFFFVFNGNNSFYNDFVLILIILNDIVCFYEESIFS